MKCLLFISHLFCFLNIYTQSPEIVWDNTISAKYDDWSLAIDKTSDGGSIVGGYSFSAAFGDKTVDSWNDDYWILKLNAEGIIEWQISLGGNSTENLYVIKETPDGGFIAGGNSSSLISGEKTTASYGSQDIWVVKLDATGNIIWQNSFGGDEGDYLYDIGLTSDSGYILGCKSYSDSSGVKTENGLGDYDYWVIKLNDIGEIQWQNTIGGQYGDWLRSVEQTTDGGYILGGYSSSNIFGDKTENSFALTDYWIIKLDAIGNIVWQNTIGGDFKDELYRITQTIDGGYLATGISMSALSGDKTEENASWNYDFWIIKLNDIGEITWQQTIGGYGEEKLHDMYENPDGSFILGGSSASNISVDKSENSRGGLDYWIVKIDNLGNIIWQKTIGGSEDDVLYGISPTLTNGIICTGISASDISGEKSEVSANPPGSYDYWVVKLEPEICSPTPELCNTLDDNCNGLIDDDVIETITITAVGATEFCQGGSVILNATYSGTSAQWQKNGVDIPGAITSSYTATTKGNYSCVTTSDCNSATSEPIFVNVFKNPKAIISAAGPTTFCVGGSVTLNVAPVAGSSYQWYKNALPIPGATATNYLATSAGIYKCKVTKIVTGCYKNSSGITVTVPCKEGAFISSESTVTISPNPSAGLFTVSAFSQAPLENNSSAQLEIYNAIGQVIYTQLMETTDGQINCVINLQHIASGIYFVRLNAGGLCSEKKLIIQQ